jgi:membrane-bound lytic murein transglycosylase A
MKRVQVWAGVGIAAALSACATTPTPSRPSVTAPGRPAALLQPARFSDLPNWRSADLAPALTAFRRQCARWSNLTPDQSIAAGAAYGGPLGAWLPACSAAQSVAPGGERSFFEAYFTPASINYVGGEARLTGYFEPVIMASRTPAPGLTEPLLRKPSDMVTVDVAGFAAAYDDPNLRGAPRILTGQLQGARVEPYPQRGSIPITPDQIIGYAHPADVYELQVQGSGRLGFIDGTQARAQYAAQNGYKWRSALGALKDSGQLANTTWEGLRAWIDANGADAARSALDADPSYVFFAEEPIADPNLGPRGAAGVNLTAMGSIAVDPAFHPYGALLYVDGSYDGAPFDRLLVAQDTGGAIKRGPLRGDVFFGSGPAAGAAAERMNAPARIWTLLPKAVPIAMLGDAPSRG